MTSTVAAAASGGAWGMLLAIVVTRRLHRQTTGWGARLGDTRFRRANLPVGGTLALLAALPARDGLEVALVAAAGTAAATAIGWRYVDPLPSVPARDRIRRIVEHRARRTRRP